MKKAIKITAVIFAIIAGLTMLTFIGLGSIVGMLASDKDFINQLVQSMNEGAPEGYGYTAEQVVKALELYKTFLITLGLVRLVSIAFDITYVVLASKTKEASKYVWIALGIIGIFVSSIIPAILAIIYGARQEHFISKDTPQVQEVRFEEKPSTGNNTNTFDNLKQ